MAKRLGPQACVRRWALVGLGALALLAPPAVLEAADAAGSRGPAMVAAHEGDDTIRYAGTVTVTADGSLDIDESYRLVRTALSTEPDFTRSITTREQYDADNDRVYDVSAVEASVDGEPTDVEISTDDDAEQITIAIPSDQTIHMIRLSYRVSGAVAQTADGLEVRWPVVQGISYPIDRASVVWNAPDVVWLSCLAGAPGSSRPCTTAQLVDPPTPRMTQVDLAAGDQLVGILGLTADSGVAPSVKLEPRRSLSRSFTASGAPLWLALGVLALGVAGAMTLWWTRGRDAGGGEPAPVDPLVDVGDGRVTVAAPGGVRPGQLGTLVDEHADVVDVSATVVDLATRNYVFIEEIPRGAYGRMDWRLRRRNEAGEELLGFEREVLSALFADGDDVLVSELAGSIRARLGGIQALMYDDMVGQGWFAERPDAVRGRWTTAGWVLVAAGVVMTVALALAGTFGLVGVALVLAGVVLALAGQLAPARTSKGAQLLRELEEFRRWMESADVTGEIPEDQRELVVSRLFAYAVVFGLAERWAGALASLDEDPDPDAPLHWYGAPRDWHLADAAPSLGHLVTTLNAAFGSRRLLSD